MELVSLKSNKKAEYQVITQLPSAFRSYPFNKVYIRGLYFDEAVSLTRFVDDGFNYEQLSAVYEDVIRFPIDSFSLLELELVDFLSLIAVSSVWTAKNHSWATGFKCKNSDCDGIINSPIILDDFDFDEPKVKTLPIPMVISDLECNISALTVKDIITIDNADEDESNFLSYALMIKNEMSIDEKLNLIKYASPYQVEDLIKLDKELEIANKPVVKYCPVCRTPLDIHIQLTQLKTYP